MTFPINPSSRKTRSSSDRAGIIAAIIVGFLFWPLEAWALMLFVGIVHKDILPAVQPIGYGWTCFALTTLLPVITTGTAFQRSKTLK